MNFFSTMTMKTKLTLFLDKNLILRVKEVARRQGVSLSTLVTDYFQALLAIEARHEVPQTPILSEIIQILSRELDKEGLKKEYRAYLEQKYR